MFYLIRDMRDEHDVTRFESKNDVSAHDEAISRVGINCHSFALICTSKKNPHFVEFL